MERSDRQVAKRVVRPQHSVMSSRSVSPSASPTLSTGSMVAITHSDVLDSPAPHLDQLLYSKSKVYVHPTAYARDNIPGFVALTKRDGLNPTYLLAWIPETLLDAKGPGEWDKFTKVEAKTTDEDDDIVLVDLPTRGESYAFSVPLSSVYSLVVHPPSLSSWYGSVGINLINGSNLPTLHFHDDESNSLQNGSASYSWGGEDLLQRLRQYSNLLRSSLQTSLFLLDPSRQDIETHSTLLFNDDSVDNILHTGSPVPPHRRPRPQSVAGSPSSSERERGHIRRNSVLHQTFAPIAPPSPSSQARSALLASFSNITRATRHAAQNILSHPLAKPILPHLPDPVKSLVNANGEWASWVEKGGVGEFESARIYLAKWARVVAEEGERARRREAQAIPASSSSSSLSEESSDLGVFELLRTTLSSSQPPPKASRDPLQPVDRRAWDKFFSKDGSGRPRVSWAEFRHEIFRRGLTPGVRKTAWPFLLGVIPWDADSAERDKVWESKKLEYEQLKGAWCGVEEVFNREDVLEERHRIDVDCRRTDRTQPLFAIPPDASLGASSFSPNIQDIGAQPPSNEHVDALAGILLTYNLYEKELGYVQGMSDLCAPIYIALGADEAMTFWCFVKVMDRMKPNFYRDQSGMKKQLSTLQELLAVMDPEIYRHLEKVDGLNLFFCFRWILIAFKREFGFEDVLRLWEVLWTDYYSNQFILFVALAVIESHRDVILRYLVEFDEILKYCNELSGTIELDSTLAQAEVLFLSFAQLLADIDRRSGESQHTRIQLRRRKSTAADGTVVPTPATPSETAALESTQMPKMSDNLRELLRSGREQ